MGERVTDGFESGIKQDDTGRNTGKAEGNPDPRTGKAAGRSEGRTDKAEEKPSPLATVNDGITVPMPEQPKKQTRKRTKRKKETQSNSLSASSISALIVGASSIVASRENLAVWQLSEAEANQIAIPLANMIEKNEQLAKLTEHSDAIALTTAAIMIFAPRAVMQYDLSKKNRGERNVGTEKPSNGNGGINDSAIKTTVQHNDNGIASAIPAIL